MSYVIIFNFGYIEQYNIILIIKMKTNKLNRSLKEIKFQYHKFNEESPTNQHKIHVLQSPSSNINIDSISNQMKKYEQGNHQQLINIKYQKFTQSHSKLEIPTIKYIPLSPREDYKTERATKIQEKNQNIEITPFEFTKPSKYIQSSFRPFAPLTPVNRNTCVEEPKRPKILNKPKQLNFFEQFKLGKVLGKGRFGNVYIAQHKMVNFIVAVKQISLAKMSAKLAERLMYEIKIQSFLKNMHCLEMYRYYKQNNNLYLVLEYGESSLFDKLREKRFFTEPQSAYYIIQTMMALQYLHKNNIIHRDLKPQNIVLINNIVKLADFGWSIYTSENSKRSTFCGTLDYVSPEIVMGNQYDKMVDVWSVGVLCYELCTGHAPFQSTKSREQTYKKIVNVDLKFPKYLSEQVKDFIKKLLTKKPQNRMSLQQALNHCWIKKYITN